MVYVALYTTGEYFMHIYEPRERIDHEKYCEVLNKQIDWHNENFPELPPSSPGAPVFTQDGARPHTARGTIDFLTANFGENFWRPNLWPPYSPEINPLDNAVWSYMEMCANTKPLNTYDELRNAIQYAAERILTPEYVRHVTRKEKVRDLLQRIIDADGEQID